MLYFYHFHKEVVIMAYILGVMKLVRLACSVELDNDETLCGA